MPKSRPPRRKKGDAYARGIIKNSVKPKWMRVTKLVAMIVLGIMMLFALAGMLIKYLRLVSQQ